MQLVFVSRLELKKLNHKRGKMKTNQDLMNSKDNQKKGAYMTMNENTIKGKWLEIKGDLQKSWGKLTDDELEKTKGDIKAIGGLIQQRYGEKQEIYSKKLNEIFKRFEIQKEKMTDEVKKTMKN